VVAQAVTARPVVGQDKWVEEPLSEREVAVMRQHLRFLREHRKVLHLKVNAQEDLLLNEARPPTRRGVCQHLLAKVDRSRVFAAAERLEPAAATRLVEGVLRISPDLDYLILYLDCVRRSASQQQAVLALSEALEHLDFSSLSAVQLRRLLELIVEVLDERQRRQVLLALLSGQGFRDAVDRTHTDLPPALSDWVVPLKAVHSVVLLGKGSGTSSASLEQGVRALLEGDPRTLLSYPNKVRRRLLELGAQASGATGLLAENLRRLLDSFKQDEREHGQLGTELARAWLAAGDEPRARDLLQALVKQYPSYQLPRRWLAALAAPRCGPLALIEPPAPDAGAVERGSGLWLETLQRVWIYAAPAESAQYRALVDLWQGLTCPSVAPVVYSGRHSDGRDYLAVRRIGRRLDARFKPAHERAVFSLCWQLSALLGALARFGVALPDAELGRFEVCEAGRLWLVDLRGAERADAEARHLELARARCSEILALADRWIFPEPLITRVREASSSSELARVFAFAAE